MNKKNKERLQKQNTKLFEELSTHFQLPVFQDEIKESEKTKGNNYFLIVYGDMASTKEGEAYQEVFVAYVTEKNPNVEEETLDIITIGDNVPGFSFYRTVKERFRYDDTDNYVDQVTVVFRRLIKYDRGI